MATVSTTTIRDIPAGNLCKSIKAEDTTAYGIDNYLPKSKFKMRTFTLVDYISRDILDVKISDMETPTVDFDISLLSVGTANVDVQLFISRADIPGGDFTFRTHLVDCIIPQGV